MSELHYMDQITEKIWLGNFASSKDINELKNRGIKKVLCIMDYPPFNYEEKDGINQKVIKIPDIPVINIIKHFGECLNFISGEDKVLVHCLAGSSRSASFVIAYIMWNQKMKFQAAFDLVKNKRSSIYPNYGFIQQLELFQELLEKNEYDITKINFQDIKWKLKPIII